MKYRILAVDDEQKMLDLMEVCLSAEKYLLFTEREALAVMQKIRQEQIDLVLLDIMMPEKDGRELLLEIKQTNQAPAVIMLTALGDTEDIVKGLYAGADDYITKPFEPSELTARIDAVLRRTQFVASSNSLIYQAHGIEMNENTREVNVEGEALIFTKKEFEILFYMVRSPGQVFTRDQLLDIISSIGEQGTDRSIDAHIKNIREKLKQKQPERVYIETVWGIGYKVPQEGGKQS